MRQRPLQDDRASGRTAYRWLFGGRAILHALLLTAGAGLLWWYERLQTDASPIGHVLLLPVAILAIGLILRSTAYVVVLPLLLLLMAIIIKFKKPPADYPCPVCGYDTRATPNRCPECGTPLQWGLWTRPTKRPHYRARARQ